MVERQCGECTECCKGWLTANIAGHEIFPGRPCHFIGGGCTIYEDRPDACRVYTCDWREDTYNEFPEWMRPDRSGVIVTQRLWGDGQHMYLEVRECGRKIESDILAWIYQFCGSKGMFLRIQIGGGWHIIGSDDFAQEIDAKYPNPHG